MSVEKNAPAVTQSSITFDDAARYTLAIAVGYQKATYLLTASLVVAMIANTYPASRKNDKGDMVTPKPIGMDETITRLKADLVPAGLKNAMIYRYIAMAKGLCLKMLTTEGKFGGAIGQVLMAKSAKAGTDIIYAHIVSKVGETGTVDDLLTYTRPAPRAGADAPADTSVKPSTSSPETIVARLVKEPTILAGMKPDVLLGAMGQQDDDTKVKFVDRAIDGLATPEALKHVIDHARSRLAAMAKPVAQPKPRNGKNAGVEVEKVAATA